MTHAVIITTGRKSRDEQLQFSLNGTEVRVMEAEGGKKTWRIFLGDGVNACNAEGKKKGRQQTFVLHPNRTTGRSEPTVG